LAHAETYPLSYGGRLTEASGAPAAGAVDLDVNFYDAASNGSKLGRSPYEFHAIPTQDGIFSLSIDLSPGDLQAVFPSPSAPAWIEIVDKTHGVTYPRQRIAPVPQAMRVPIDESTLEFDATGRLTVKTGTGARIPELQTALDGDLAGTLDAPVVAGLRSHPIGAASRSGSIVLQAHSAVASARQPRHQISRLKRRRAQPGNGGGMPAKSPASCGT
jgi:hypothetical protein